MAVTVSEDSACLTLSFSAGESFLTDRKSEGKGQITVETLESCSIAKQTEREVGQKR